MTTSVPPQVQHTDRQKEGCSKQNITGVFRVGYWSGILAESNLSLQLTSYSHDVAKQVQTKLYMTMKLKMCVTVRHDMKVTEKHEEKIKKKKKEEEELKEEEKIKSIT